MQRMDECYNRIEKLKTDGFGQDNKSSIAQLFLSFFGQVLQFLLLCLFYHVFVTWLVDACVKLNPITSILLVISNTDLGYS